MDRGQAKEFLMNQERGFIGGDGALYSEKITTITENDFLLPIPVSDINKDPNLLKEPVQFDFENTTIL